MSNDNPHHDPRGAAFAACGDNIKPNNDGDAGRQRCTRGIPTAPALGTADRSHGRPAINTALNHAFDPTAATAGTRRRTRTTRHGSPGAWPQNAAQFAENLAIIDSLDGRLRQPGLVQRDHRRHGSGTAVGQSYARSPTILADDELYLDTTIGKCDIAELASELSRGRAQGRVERCAHPHDCGGRASAQRRDGDELQRARDRRRRVLRSDGNVHAEARRRRDGAHRSRLADFPFLGAPH